MAKLRETGGNEALEAKPSIDLDPRTELGREVMRLFRDAVMHKESMKVGDHSLSQLLDECYAARDDRTLCEELADKELYPGWTDMPVSLVSFKVNILVALIRETLVDVSAAPFIVDPTPNPEIPEDERRKIIDHLTADVLGMAKEIVAAQDAFLAQAQASGVDPTLAANTSDFPQLSPALVTEAIKQKKIAAMRGIRDHAKQQAQLLERDLYDKTTEGGYRQAIMAFADDFATYPFGCIHGPFPAVKNVAVWDKNKFVEKQQVVWAFERVSPFDLFWTEDSPDTQSGTAVFIRKQVGYDYLFDAKQFAEDDEDSGYQLDAIEALIEQAHEGNIPHQWTEFVVNPENGPGVSAWRRGDNIEIVICYGRFTGYELSELGFKDLKENKVYETKIIMCGGHIILCQVNNNPSQYKRPVFTASFESRNNSIVGVGLGQKLLSLHKAYRAVTRLMLYNLGLSSEPITEVEFNRVSQYLPLDWVDNPTINPGMVIPADGDRMGNGSRAIKFTQIPNTTESALRLANYIFEQAHVISNIPAALHGQPVGSGANRTVRGLLTLQGNTLKPIQSALMNLDLGVIEPMVTLLYMLLVMYEDGFDYTGDCKIVAKGAASMIQREQDKQQAMENLQILGQLGPQINPELLNRTIMQLLATAGILEPGESALATPSPIPPQDTTPQAAPQGQPTAAEPQPIS